MSVSPFEFCDAAARLTVIYKDQHEQRLATLCALAILEVMPKDWIQWADLVCYIPADRRAIRKRGFCHMRLVAEEFSRLTGLMLTHVLQKETVRDQRSLNRSERAENLARAFRLADTSARVMTNEKINGIKDTTDISGKNIILLDDVCTTTATLNIAGEVLLTAGAIEVRAATVCRVY
jgi:predicted amidophosphoribosyltransferase